MSNDKEGEVHVIPMANEHYEKGELEKITHPNLKQQMHQQALTAFSKTACNCTKHSRLCIHQIQNKLKAVSRFQRERDRYKENDEMKIPLEKIASATNNFGDQNLIYKDEYIDVYKGKLLGSGQLGNIVVRGLQQKTMLRMLEYCVEHSNPRILVYKHVGNGRLKKDVSDPTFNWMERLQTCNRLASGFILRPGFDLVGRVGLGDLMFEVICEKKGEEHATPMAIQHYRKGELEKIIHPHLRLQMHHQSLTVFSKTAYNCIRPPCINIHDIVKRLQKALELQMEHEKYLDNIEIKLKDIRLSTNNFAKECVIGSGTYGTVYKAELDYFDRKSSSIVRDTVAIKRISKRADGLGDQGFFAELNMLSSCEHRNIISLLGFCHEGSKRILVYEYAFKQSLSEYLGNTNDKVILTWAKRLQICLDIAYGLDYLHNNREDKPRIIHRDVKSDNILIGENWNAKIGDFGLSKFHPINQQASTINTEVIAGTPFYLDPEYEKTGQLKKESDIYSFGVVLFEILSGRLAYDPIYLAENNNGLPAIARQHFSEGTLKEIVDPQMKEHDELIPTVCYGPHQDSLDTFSKIAYRCLAETQVERPTIEEIIEELQNALNFQENRADILLNFSLENLKLCTENFSENNCIIRGAFGKAYSGKVQYQNKLKDIVAMRLYRCSQEEDYSLKQEKEDAFLQEVEILMKHKHENIVDLIGYCKEENEKIIVYELASIGSLVMHLSNPILGWVERLKICIDVASGLNFLHEGVQVIHRDIKSASILLNGDWRAKISDFRLSFVAPVNKEIEHNDVLSTPGYCDPSYWGMSFLTKESDIYSLGVVLFEILCGRSTMENYNYEGQFLDDLVKKLFEERRLDEIVFEGIKPQIVSESLITFQKIANQCLHHRRHKRPTSAEVVVQLKKALEFQIEHSSVGGMGNHSTGERVLKFPVPSDPHVDCSEDAVVASHERLDTPANLEPGHSGQGLEHVLDPMENEVGCLPTASEVFETNRLKRGSAEFIKPKSSVVVDVYGQTMFEKYALEPNTHLSIDPQQWEQSVESLKTPGRFVFDATQDSKFALTGSRAGCSAEKSHDVGLALEVQELRDNIEKMEQYQKELETQLQAERARTTELEEMIVDMKAREVERHYKKIRVWRRPKSSPIVKKVVANTSSPQPRRRYFWRRHFCLLAMPTFGDDKSRPQESSPKAISKKM